METRKLARISYNSSGWQRPTGEAGKNEGTKTYNARFGFGHEDWLFRDEWQLNGWRYAFIQGVNKSRRKLLRTSPLFDLTLFTQKPGGKRRLVADIFEVECLGDQQAEEAKRAFQDRGWYSKMLEEIKEVGGDPSNLGAPKFANHMLNVRFRLENIHRYPRDQYIETGNPILKWNYYVLYNYPDFEPSALGTKSGINRGFEDLPKPKAYWRKGSSAMECSPEHMRMQAELMKSLRRDYPQAAIRREEGAVDVSVNTGLELLLFEIKSDRNPRTVIRLALGQILEYGFHPSRDRGLPVRLFIVGRLNLPPEDDKYLSLLKERFKFPIEYRAIPIGD